MQMAPVVDQRRKKETNRGAWTAEEDEKLAQVISIHGPRRWRSIAAKTGLNRCGKSCRLRWMNYLRPNIKRGNISDQEEDLILRLHKLLGNRWSLIAGRLPGRTDNEIKNYWNSHLSKKLKQIERYNRSLSAIESEPKNDKVMEVQTATNQRGEGTSRGNEDTKSSLIWEELFDNSSEGPLNLEWMSKFLEMDESWFYFA
ncbi:hypothetical protein FEM48_Zijuj06G0058600 [Ziziphus jujuba var. spinosa]|uniref:Transcription factor MYB114-like n=1 Tax=Ziziphus jujuba var. spinosa TaxID=714518 RepID=A0A978V7J2_ZIZJJ|nr:hypothetical protein FEM48_Zijuj06G0058600 [Ziziphus jujuba var. spinosa]